MMHSPFSLYLALVVLSLGVVAVQSGCSTDAQSKDLDAEAAPEVASVPVEVASARLGSIAAFYTGTATLEAEDDAEVVAEVSGVVRTIHAQEGRRVRAGDVLAELDKEQSSLELARIAANLKKLEGDLERNAGLFEKNLISAEAYEAVKYTYEAEKAAHDLAQLRVANASIRAPISGVVAERHVRVGNMVAQNESTFRITDFDPLLAVLHVPERELARLRVGQAVALSADAIEGEEFEGRILRMSPLVDPATGTFRVTVEVRDPSSRLRPGLLARVRIAYDQRDEVVLVPKEAVVMEDGLASVFVVSGDTTAYRTPVVTGYSDSRSIEIADGLSEGAAVVTLGQSGLKDSARVEIIR